MAGGAFNVNELIRQMGLQRVGDRAPLELRPDIQPVVNVGSLSDLTPPHVAPTALYGSTISNVAGQRGMVEIACLSAGGGFLENFAMSTPLTTIFMSVKLTATIPGGTVVANVGQLSNEASVSVVRQANQATTGVGGYPINQQLAFANFAPRAIFVPRGAFLFFEALTDNIPYTYGFTWREVPASQFEPT